MRVCAEIKVHFQAKDVLSEQSSWIQLLVCLFNYW